MSATLPFPLRPLPSTSPALIMTLFSSRSLPPLTPVFCCGVTTLFFFLLLIFALLPSPAFLLTVLLPFGTLPKTLPVLMPRILPLFLPVVVSPTAVALNASSPRCTVVPLATSRTPRLLLLSFPSVANWTTVLCKKQPVQPCVLVLPGLKKARLVLPTSFATSGRVLIPLPFLPFALLMVLLSLLPLLAGRTFGSTLLPCVLPLLFILIPVLLSCPLSLSLLFPPNNLPLFLPLSLLTSCCP